ncbi:MAG: SpoIIE family protein phosphatase [Mariprofundaceae bacterium]
MTIAIERLAMDGGPDCGDQLAFWKDHIGHDAGLTGCVVDGLGHGLHAKKVALKIIQYVANHRSETPEKLFRGCDDAMRHERGGVMAVVWIKGDQLTYASVGNITGYLAHHNGGKYRIEHLNMDRGMIGGGFKKLNEQTLALAEGDLLIMHSDGLHPFFNLEAWHPVLDNPERLAKALLEDQGKETDDACVLVYRHKGIHA